MSRIPRERRMSLRACLKRVKWSGCRKRSNKLFRPRPRRNHRYLPPYSPRQQNYLIKRRSNPPERSLRNSRVSDRIWTRISVKSSKRWRMTPLWKWTTRTSCLEVLGVQRGKIGLESSWAVERGVRMRVIWRTTLNSEKKGSRMMDDRVGSLLICVNKATRMKRTTRTSRKRLGKIVSRLSKRLVDSLDLLPLHLKRLPAVSMGRKRTKMQVLNGRIRSLPSVRLRPLSMGPRIGGGRVDRELAGVRRVDIV